MAKIYTKTGDRGNTGLVGGTRVTKNSPLIEAIGNADELNAVLGLIKPMLYVTTSHPLPGMLDRLQSELFEIGARMAGAEDMPVPGVDWMEEAIDEVTAELPPLKNFILPGGCAPGATLHLARAVCRRFERSLPSVCEGPERVPNEVLIWANRTSDLLFILARWVNRQSFQTEVVWKPLG